MLNSICDLSLRLCVTDAASTDAPPVACFRAGLVFIQSGTRAGEHRARYGVATPRRHALLHHGGVLLRFRSGTFQGTILAEYYYAIISNGVVIRGPIRVSA